MSASRVMQGHSAGRAVSARSVARGRLRRMLDRLALWLRRSSERSQLAELDDQALRDMGLTRYDVMHEIRKPFWQG